MTIAELIAALQTYDQTWIVAVEDYESTVEVTSLSVADVIPIGRDRLKAASQSEVDAGEYAVAIVLQ